MLNVGLELSARYSSRLRVSASGTDSRGLVTYARRAAVEGFPGPRRKTSLGRRILPIRSVRIAEAQQSGHELSSGLRKHVASDNRWKAETPIERRPSGFLTTDLESLIVREVKPEEYWEAADLHCAAFFPAAPFPLDFLLRSDR